MLRIAREHDLFAVAIVLDTPDDVCVARNASRPDRDFGEHVIRRQRRDLKRSLQAPAARGFRRVSVRSGRTDGGRDRARADVDRPPRRDGAVRHHRRRPRVLRRAGRAARTRSATSTACTRTGGALVFVGDLVDRGPGVVDVLQARDGAAGRDLRARQPRRQALAQARAGATSRSRTGWPSRSSSWRASRRSSPRRCASTCTGSSRTSCSTAGGSCVAHAGMPERYQGRGSRRVREFALYGETTGETDEFGLPVRGAWAADYRGAAPRRLRPHPRARAGVAQQHDQHRHRLRLRRRADGAALARARARLRARGARVLRAGAAVPGRVGRIARTSCSTSTTWRASGSSRRG